MKNKRENKCLLAFWSYMRMAQTFNLSEKEREILIDILNEPVPDDCDYYEPDIRIAALLNLSSRDFSDGFSNAVGDVNEEINIRRN